MQREDENYTVGNGYGMQPEESTEPNVEKLNLFMKN